MPRSPFFLALDVDDQRMWLVREMAVWDVWSEDRADRFTERLVVVARRLWITSARLWLDIELDAELLVYLEQKEVAHVAA